MYNIIISVYVRRAKLTMKLFKIYNTNINEAFQESFKYAKPIFCCYHCNNAPNNIVPSKGTERSNRRPCKCMDFRKKHISRQGT